MRTLETAISEQQKIFVKRGNIDPSRNNMGYYLIQMPSEKISAICVMHLMKQLFQQFVQDVRNFEEDFSLIKAGQEEAEFKPKDLKLPAI